MVELFENDSFTIYFSFTLKRYIQNWYFYYQMDFLSIFWGEGG